MSATAVSTNGHHDTETISETDFTATHLWVCRVKGRVYDGPEQAHACIGGGPGTEQRIKAGETVTPGVKPTHRTAGCGWFGSTA